MLIAAITGIPIASLDRCMRISELRLLCRNDDRAAQLRPKEWVGMFQRPRFMTFWVFSQCAWTSLTIRWLSRLSWTWTWTKIAFTPTWFPGETHPHFAYQFHCQVWIEFILWSNLRKFDFSTTSDSNGNVHQSFQHFHAWLEFAHVHGYHG